MNKKRYFLIISLLIFSITFGQKTAVKSTQKLVIKTSPYVIHIVKFGETLTKIAQKYNVTIKDIVGANPSLTENNLNPKQMLRIPNKGNKKILTGSKTSVNDLQAKIVNPKELMPNNPKYHIVEAGQTMYSISKKYNIKVDDLQKWNGLMDYNVKVGTQLIILDSGGIKNPKIVTKIPTIAKEKVIKKSLPQAVETDILLFKKNPVVKESVEESAKNDVRNIETETPKLDIPASDNVTQKDLAKIFKEKSILGNIQITKGTGAPIITALGAMESVYFVMHKWLPIGSIIKVKNLVNSKIVYAKVIGKLPDTDENKHIIIRYTIGVKKDLQLQNGKCYIQIEYSN